jgi:hypothetical protein
MKSSEPFRARAHAEINIYDTLDAVEHFAAHYPAERLDIRDANRLLRAAALWIRRAAAAKFSKIDQAAPVVHGRLGPVPPVDPELARLLGTLKNLETNEQPRRPDLNAAVAAVWPPAIQLEVSVDGRKWWRAESLGQAPASAFDPDIYRVATLFGGRRMLVKFWRPVKAGNASLPCAGTNISWSERNADL